MKNKLASKKIAGSCTTALPPCQQPSQQSEQSQTVTDLLLSTILFAMTESRSTSPIALTTKPAPGSAAASYLAHFQQLQQLQQQQQQNLRPQLTAENLVPDHGASEHIDQAAAESLVNLSNQHSAARQGVVNNGSTAIHQLPPACGAKQLSKLKRFLTNLVQFARDLAPEVCDRVRLLILALVNNLINVEEFHSKLQDLTGYPLRPFVIPFLKANLPLLQRELVHCARLARQTPQQFLLSNESLVYAPLPSGGQQQSATGHLSPANKAASPLPGDPSEVTESPFDLSPFNTQRQHHRLRERSPDNGSVHSSRSSPSNSKRVRSRSPLLNRQTQQQQTPPNKNGTNQGVAKTPVPDTPARQGQLPPPLTSVTQGASGILAEADIGANEEMWRLLEQQMTSLTEAMTSCRRTAVALRERSREEVLGVVARARIAGARLGVAGASQEVDEIRRKAEEAVNEIKRQACLELQRGVAAAEIKAREMVEAERARMMRELTQAKQRGYEEAVSALSKQEESLENCANCGRTTTERCGACEQVRYCGRFCQLHDWPKHRQVCRQLTSGVEAVPEKNSDKSSVNVTTTENSPQIAVDSPPPVVPTQEGPSRNRKLGVVKTESSSPTNDGRVSAVSSCSGQAGADRPESRHSTSATSVH